MLECNLFNDGCKFKSKRHVLLILTESTITKLTNNILFFFGMSCKCMSRIWILNKTRHMHWLIWPSVLGQNHWYGLFLLAFPDVKVFISWFRVISIGCHTRFTWVQQDALSLRHSSIFNSRFAWDHSQMYSHCTFPLHICSDILRYSIAFCRVAHQFFSLRL